MNSLRQYITEKFQVGNDYKRQYAYYPKNKDELIKCIKDKIKKEGLGTKRKPLDLNDIDTSAITNMSTLFDSLNGELKALSINGHFDISDWDVSNVEDMSCMFYGSKFDGDLSDWDVSNVEYMSCMFRRCKFDGDLSDWDVSNVKDMYGMFAESEFSAENGDISGWNVSNVTSMNYMFYDSPLQNHTFNWHK